MVAFFFAFHPAGVDNGAIRNPVDILQWMFGRFDDTVAGGPAGSANDIASTGPSLTPAGNAGGTIPTGGHSVHLSEQA